MKKIYLLILCLSLSCPTWGAIDLGSLLNKVTLKLQAEQWVTTQTALVTVAINAAIADQSIDKLQTAVMQKLTQLSDKGEWHLLSFNRQLDKSGLESVQIQAQARLPQSELANLRDKTKAISKPGETFTLDNIQFVPSDEELRQANTTLRRLIYQQAKAEIDTLNQQYPEQKYYLHQIDFITPPSIMPLPANAMMRISGAPPSRPPLSVGNKQTIEAMVVLASMPDLVAQQLVGHR